MTVKKHFRMLWIGFLALSVAITACAGDEWDYSNGDGEPQIWPTTAAPAPAREEEPPGTSPEVSGLRQELYFTGGGGDGVYCHNVAPNPEESLPVVRVYRAPGDDGRLCLFGFPLEEGEVGLYLYPPDGSVYFAQLLLDSEGGIIQLNHPAETDADRWIGYYGSAGFAEIFFWWPASLPAGRWSAIIGTGDRYEFDVSYDAPAISTVPLESVLEGMDVFESHGCADYRAGEQVFAEGAGFRANLDLPIGIYWRESFDIGSLVGSISVQTGSGDCEWGRGGCFSMLLREIKATDPPGEYLVVAVTDPDVDTYSLLDPVDSNLLACYHIPEGSTSYCGGTSFAGYCWYVGEENDSCDTVCASQGGYDEATRTYAGSDGPPSNCRSLLTALNVTLDEFLETAQGGIGCFISRNTTGNYSGYWDRHPTTASATYQVPGRRRICACRY